MGFDINEEITTKLNFRDVALISVALCRYIEEIKDHKKDDSINELIQRATSIVDRLGNEISNTKR